MADEKSATDKVPVTSKYTVPFTAIANAALMRAARAKRMEPTEVIQRAVIEHLIREGFLGQEDAERFRLFWRLVDHTVKKAQEICRRGAFKESITLDAIHLCMQESWWVEGYRTYVRDDIYKNGNKEKGPINREIGFRIRGGIGGFVKKDENGKSMTTKVLGEIIQSYTPMTNYDRDAFGPTKTAA